MDYKAILEKVYNQVSKQEDKGALASYIPELARVDPLQFAVHVSNISGDSFGLGDIQTKFSIQSMAKVLSFCLAYKTLGESIWKRLGVEPSGNAFNSLVQLENDQGIPRNPFINAGAIVIADILISQFEDPSQALLDFIRSLSPNQDIAFSNTIFESEKNHGFRNIALCNFIKSFNNLDNEPEEVLDFYFKLCSLEMSCTQLSGVYLFLANNGKALHNNQTIISKSQSKRINALMQTCGFYDESGEFAFKVGLPGKSGVGGGIIAIHPNQYAIAVWSPKLNKKGNSFKGMLFLEQFTTASELSIF